ncbi:DUF2092 domain-containing protein [Shimia haliotis]|uniref:DUF2092 domain-containing protein n=1 Tax=Shimia haliotis TaxID=1280847 RepID=A0A1I4GLR7_9RHOB|nr:DUF2092 domain-containing protein [Shimia haliotis]SFL30307.1 hypothetical protein SAMN04488036_10921 [Shimia haliotis]
MSLAKLFRNAAVFAFAIASASAADEGAPPPDGQRLDPRALEVVEMSAAAMAAQETMAVNWFVSFDQVIDGREKLTHLRSGRALVARPDKYYAYAEQDDGLREYFYDGLGLTVFLPEGNAYAHKPFFGPFEDLAAVIQKEHGESLPIWQVLVSNFSDEFLSDVTDAAYLGVKRVTGIEVHHVALSSYDGDLQMWISTEADNPVPVMLVGTNPYAQGWPQFRAYFSDWDFAPVLTEDSFTFFADEDVTRLVWPKKQDGGE